MNQMVNKNNKNNDSSNSLVFGQWPQTKIKFSSMQCWLLSILPGTFFCSHDCFVRPLKQGRSFYLPCMFSNTRNGCPNRAKCSCYLGPGGQATRHFSLFTYKATLRNHLPLPYLWFAHPKPTLISVHYCKLHCFAFLLINIICQL